MVRNRRAVLLVSIVSTTAQPGPFISVYIKINYDYERASRPKEKGIS